MFNGEGGTLEGTKGSGAIASHVERKSHYLVTAKFADKAADTMTIASANALLRIPHCVIVGCKVGECYDIIYSTKEVANGMTFKNFTPAENLVRDIAKERDVRNEL
jgi:hypothetical protein